MKITVLGCGSSTGTPALGRGGAGGYWGQCDPNNPKNSRKRASLLVEYQGKFLLIDTSPDLRNQLLPLGLQRMDAIFFTHDHGDHVHGIDEMRNFYYLSGRQSPYPVYGSFETLQGIQNRFSYLFNPVYAKDVPILTPNPKQYGDFFTVEGVPVTLFAQDHGCSLSTGYRLGAFAYSTDVKHLDDTAFSFLEGLDTWMVDCLSLEPRKTHAHLEQTLQWIHRIKPKRAILTHMSPSLDYNWLLRVLPSGVEPAFDGMEILIGSSP